MQRTVAEWSGVLPDPRQLTKSFLCKSLQEQEARLVIFRFQQSKGPCRGKLNIAMVVLNIAMVELNIAIVDHTGMKQNGWHGRWQLITQTAKEEDRFRQFCYHTVVRSCLQDWWTQQLEKWNCLLVVTCWCSQFCSMCLSCCLPILPNIVFCDSQGLEGF